MKKDLLKSSECLEKVISSTYLLKIFPDDFSQVKLKIWYLFDILSFFSKVKNLIEVLK